MGFRDRLEASAAQAVGDSVRKQVIRNTEAQLGVAKPAR